MVRGRGQDILTQASVKVLPDKLPEFFRSASAEKMIAHCAYAPDVSKNHDMPHARIAEHGEYYFDLELITLRCQDPDALARGCRHRKITILFA